MIRIMVMNGLLISLILIWTSSAKEPSAGNLIKSSTKPSTGPLNYSVSKPLVSLHETNKEILSRKFVCGSEFGGVCVNKKKSCPSNLPSEKSPGKPYCSNKKHRCCYPDPTTAAPPTVVPTTTTTYEDVIWSDIRNACIKSNNYYTYQPLTFDICKEKCVEEDAINCQSIEYSSAQQMCAISEARSDSDDFIEPCFVDGWVFAEIELNTGPTTGAPTTLAPSNTTTNGQTTGAPTTTASSNTTTNVSCNLVWNYEEDRPLIMIRETKTIVPPIIDKDISEDPNRIPEGKKLIFACPGENNQFNHVQGTHTKLHGECISHEQFKVCVNNYPEILDLSQLSCSSKMQPSIIKQDNDTSYKKSCEDIGGELYKMGYIYGDYKEFKDLDTKFCFREKDQTTLWTSTNIDRIDISPSIRSMDPANFRTARGFAMNTFYSQKSQQETLKEILDKEATSVWNDKACRNHGGHCVRGGRPCPKHLPHHTSQGEPFCTSFYRCCYSGQCDPKTCTYKGQKGSCSLDSLPGTTGVGSQECKKGCQCYIKDNKTSRHSKSLQERKEFSKRMLGPKPPTCNGVVVQETTCNLDWEVVKGKPTGFRPLILDNSPLEGFPKLILPLPEPGIRITSGTLLVFACSGRDEKNNNIITFLTPKLENEHTVHAICEDGNINIDIGETKESFDIMDMGCKVWIESDIIPKIDPNKKQEVCGPQQNGLSWQIAFDYNLKGESDKFFPQIDVCFEKNDMSTLYTIHTLHGKSISERFVVGRGTFKKTGDFFGNIPMDTIYDWEEERKILGDIIKSPQIGFNKGHISPAVDFVTFSQQKATYDYINALPQWQDYNSGNYKFIELEIILKLAIPNGIDLKIIGGGSGIMEKDGKPIFLANSIGGEPNKVPVPNYIWKVVIAVKEKKTKAVVFIINNDPIVTIPPTPPVQLCTENRCGELKDWMNKKLIKNLIIEKKGYTYCCKLSEVDRDISPNVPRIEGAELLTNLNWENTK